MLSDPDSTRKLKLTFPVQIPHSLPGTRYGQIPGGGGVDIAPVARDTSNYWFVRQIGLKTLLLWRTVLIISSNLNY